MSDRRILVAAAAVAALVAVVVVGTGLGWWNASRAGAAPPRPLAVKTMLAPHPALFGDIVTAEVDVTLDPAKVDAKTVRVSPTFEPYAQTGPAAVSTGRVGRHVTMRYVYTLQCATDECVPLGKPLAVHFPRVTVTAGALHATATWPATAILSRLQKADTSATAHFRTQRVPPPVSYAASPGLLADLLTASAGLLAAIALLLAGWELRLLLRRRHVRGAVRLTPLEAALAYTRDSAGRAAADRRKALGELARVLESEGDPALADRAGDVAWSEEDPSPDRALEVAEEVEGRA